MSHVPTSTLEIRGPETAHLARDLVRMEDEAKRLERNGEYGAAQSVWAERDRLREFRSSLLRTQLRLRERRA